MQDPRSSKFQETGFPTLSWEEEDLPTRPMAFHERPIQARIDQEMAVVASHHLRIAMTIDRFWGHKDCVEYLQTLILNGGFSDRKDRVGFKPEVLSALINLAGMHDEVT